ncbi:MAG TPA: SpoIIE family protein phosphatase [Tenuifilaceae bacterium]|nr:SpoIIE family protein phosphatase [Tenuifilaceae bacterium]
MRRTQSCFILFFVFIFLSQSSASQDIGRYPVVNFHHREYSGHSQSWSIVQDKRGLIYIANNVGVIEYDGSEWRHISINGALPRCLDVDVSGRVWVGAQDDFGYLAADSSNSLKFYSLSKYLPETYKPFGLIRQVYHTNNGVFFSANNLLIQLKPDLSVKVWTPKTIFHRTYLVDDIIFSNQKDFGLTYLFNDTLKQVPGGEIFAKKLVYTILPFDEQYFIVGTQSDGFFLINRESLNSDCNSDAQKPCIIKFKTEDDNFLSKNWIYSGLKVTGDVFAIGTYRGGVVFIDKRGQFIRRINQKVGLQDDAVWHLHKDNQDNLWMALNNGISYTSIHSQLTEWDEESGFKGVLQSVVRFNNDIYLTSNVGVFRKQNGRFAQVAGINDLSWKLKVISNEDGSQSLLVASSSGIYYVKGETAWLIEDGLHHAYSFIQSKVYPNIIYVGLRDGVGVIRNYKGHFKFVGKLDGTYGEVYTLAEDNNGDLWYSERYKGVGFLDIVNPYQLFHEKPVKYTLPNNPKYDDMSVVLIDGVVKSSSEGGLARFDSNKNVFVPDSSLGVEFADGTTGMRIFNQDYKGNIWFEAYRYAPNRWLERAIKYPNGVYRREPAQFRTIPETIFFDIYAEQDNVTWIASTDGLYRYDGSVGVRNNTFIKVLIRQVSSFKSTKVYNGVQYLPSCEVAFPSEIEILEPKTAELPYKYNSLSFSFSSPFFGQQQRLQYSYYLEGYDEEWSDWTYSQAKEYTNLPFGSYRFMVKAKNLFEVESPAASFSFYIDKPLYLKWYALVFYSLIITLIVWFVVYLNTRMLRVSNVKLQQLVDIRTKELVKSEQILLEKNLELQHQKEEILAQRDEMQDQNKHINASIQYATTIQQAILPDLSNSLDGLYEHFLIYLPKELVSGDFYWVSQSGTKGKKSEKVFIAVVDCTGHGVPGAFMSLIGSRLLSEIVNERKIHNPAAILTELSSSINLALRQDVSESFDGMDISLCMIERKSDDLYIVTFAGANRPLFYYSKGEERIHTLKGNRKSIGSVLPDVEAEFTNWRITLRPGDMIFMCTDGFTDQNNAFKRKFTTCRFHTYLLSNIDKPMDEISRALVKEFDEFKGDERQRDDITVLGIRL